MFVEPTASTPNVRCVILLSFGLFGFLMKKCGFEPAPNYRVDPGKIFEESLNRGLMWWMEICGFFLTGRLPAILMCLSLAVFLWDCTVHAGRKLSEILNKEVDKNERK